MSGARWRIYFAGGFLANSMPFSTFPLRPLVQASSSFFSWSLACSRMLMAFTAPDFFECWKNSVSWCPFGAREEDDSRSKAYPELDWHREEVDTRSLGNGIATLDTRKIDESGLDDALLALDRFEDLFGKPEEDQFSTLHEVSSATSLTGIQRMPWTALPSQLRPWP